ncbi:MAG TPA: SPOR domain-containing protein [Prolixibacteraceae bacterium]
MKNLILMFLVLSFVGCKTQKIAPKPKPVAQETVSPAAATSSAAQKNTKPVAISSKEERFTTVQGEKADFGANKYFVILGSFSVLENAKHLKETLATEGFHPVILINENGMYRVCGDNFSEEIAARTRIAEVRGNLPKYNDIWLLIKKQ